MSVVFNLPILDAVATCIRMRAKIQGNTVIIKTMNDIAQSIEDMSLFDILTENMDDTSEEEQIIKISKTVKQSYDNWIDFKGFCSTLKRFHGFSRDIETKLYQLVAEDVFEIKVITKQVEIRSGVMATQRHRQIRLIRNNQEAA